MHWPSIQLSPSLSISFFFSWPKALTHLSAHTNRLYFHQSTDCEVSRNKEHTLKKTTTTIAIQQWLEKQRTTGENCFIMIVANSRNAIYEQQCVCECIKQSNTLCVPLRISLTWGLLKWAIPRNLYCSTQWTNDFSSGQPLVADWWECNYRMEAVKFKQFNRNNQDLYLLTLRIKQKSTIKIENLKQKMNEQRNMRTSTAFTWTPSCHWVSRIKFHSSKCLLHDPSGFCTRRKTKMPVKFNDLHFIYCRFLFLSCAPIQWAFNMQLKIVQLKIKSELIHLMCIWTLRWDHCWRANVFIQNNFCLAAITLRLFLSWRFFHFSWFLLFWIILILI